mmetsp:Transcript_25008/g.99375  ORF Transcript_25008/g.99375 Transcript_25008/m.99375 type:complete len:329 (-) Transcript_25008:97-1083(-)
MLRGLRFSGDEPRRRAAEATAGDSKKRADDIAERHPKRRRDDDGDREADDKDREDAPSFAADLAVDGGVSYRRSALRRAVEESKRTGKPLAEVAAYRWGSLEALTGGDPDAVRRAMEDPAPQRRRPAARRRPAMVAADEDSDAKNVVPGDAALLRQYAAKFTEAFDAFTAGADKKKGRFSKGSRGEGRNNRRDDDADDPRGGGPQRSAASAQEDARRESNDWVGLAPRQTLGMSGSTFARGWRTSSASSSRAAAATPTAGGGVSIHTAADTTSPGPNRIPPGPHHARGRSLSSRESPPGVAVDDPSATTTTTNTDAAAALRARLGGGR